MDLSAAGTGSALVVRREVRMSPLLWVLWVGCGAEVEPVVATSPAVAAAVSAPAESAPPASVEVDGRILEGAAFRGREIARHTHRELPENVGSSLNCTNCHLEDATRAKAAPWVGVVDRYPRYRARSGKVDDLQDRMNGCFERSMNGVALPRDSEPMLALVAYAEWLSEDVPDGKLFEGAGIPKLADTVVGDASRGEAVFQEKCASCHQPSGEGVVTPDGTTVFPPLVGDQSFNLGAGMARLDTAAAFVKWGMPQGQGGTLTDQEAYDVALWFTTQPRPDFADKAHDWPEGGKPRDARY